MFVKKMFNFAGLLLFYCVFIKAMESELEDQKEIIYMEDLDRLLSEKSSNLEKNRNEENIKISQQLHSEDSKYYKPNSGPIRKHKHKMWWLKSAYNNISKTGHEEIKTCSPYKNETTYLKTNVCEICNIIFKNKKTLEKHTMCKTHLKELQNNKNRKKIILTYLQQLTS